MMTTDYRQIRLDKLEALRAAGEDGYAYEFTVTHRAGEVLAAFDELAKQEETVALAGRLMANRRQGKAGFAHLQDLSGRLQLYFKEDVLGVPGYEVYRKLDLGDIVGVRGRLFTTKTGEKTVEVHGLDLLAKALRPLPEKWHGLKDVEARSRRRYLDLIMSAESRDVFLKRTVLVSTIRTFLDRRGFLEVETPVLQPIYGGAFANPFKARYEALDTDVYLRISDELYLKRLIVGGLERVYEIGKDFRNEGMDRAHNPEFTMLELYQAYTDYRGILSLCEEMIADAVEGATGRMTVDFEGAKLDFTPPWPRLRYTEVLSQKLGRDVLSLSTEELHDSCTQRHLRLAPGASWGNHLDELFKALVEPELQQPTFVLDYPRELSPLAKVHREDPRLVERFEPFAGGMEIGNAFSEQNDPLEQQRQFEFQAALRAAGDREAHVVDLDYVRALEFGMPPTGGLGVGIDRLVMLVTGQRNIRDVILFPHLRPERPAGAETETDGDDNPA